MEILVAMFVLSFVIGRITMIENAVYKSNNNTMRFTFENIVVFFLIVCIKIGVAYLLASVFVPEESIRGINLDYGKSDFVPDVSKAIYSTQTRIILAFLGVMIGDFIGIYKIKN